MTIDELRHFLLIFDPTRSVLVSHEEFDDADDALWAYDKAEHDNRDGQLDIVLVSSDSLATVRQTHPNYFDERSLDELLSTHR